MPYAIFGHALIFWDRPRYIYRNNVGCLERRWKQSIWENRWQGAQITHALVSANAWGNVVFVLLCLYTLKTPHNKSGLVLHTRDPSVRKRVAGRATVKPAWVTDQKLSRKNQGLELCVSGVEALPGRCTALGLSSRRKLSRVREVRTVTWVFMTVR